MNASLSDSFLNKNEIITDITIQLVSIIHPHAICISINPWLLIFKLIKYRCSLESSRTKQPDLKLNEAICQPMFILVHRPVLTWPIYQVFTLIFILVHQPVLTWPYITCLSGIQHSQVHIIIHMHITDIPDNSTNITCIHWLSQDQNQKAHRLYSMI